MLRTRYWCVQSLNISVDVAKCAENFNKFMQYTHFCLLQTMTFLDWTIHSWQGFNTLLCTLMIRTIDRCVSTSVYDVAKCVEMFHKFSHSTSVSTSPNVWKSFTNSPSTLTLFSVTQNDLSWLINLFGKVLTH